MTGAMTGDGRACMPPAGVREVTLAADKDLICMHVATFEPLQGASHQRPSGNRPQGKRPSCWATPPTTPKQTLFARAQVASRQGPPVSQPLQLVLANPEMGVLFLESFDSLCQRRRHITVPWRRRWGVCRLRTHAKTNKTCQPWGKDLEQPHKRVLRFNVMPGLPRSLHCRRTNLQAKRQRVSTAGCQAGRVSGEVSRACAPASQESEATPTWAAPGNRLNRDPFTAAEHGLNMRPPSS